MGKRKRETKDTPSQYFQEASTLEFIPSGGVLLNCVLGGGYPLGRVVNIVGDKSTGKTLLAMEAATNFLLKYPEGKAKYVEAEAAFDPAYASSLGIPIGRGLEVESSIATIESLFNDLGKTLDGIQKSKTPYLYIVDSLDALSDEAELARDLNEGSYGAAKAKKLSELFRRQVKKIEASRMCVIIISQVRDNIGVTFGEKHKRSGGRALDFYASQVLWLAYMGQIKKKRMGIERTIGVEIKASCKKNKVGLPFRTCEFDILFQYGIKDDKQVQEWLKKIGKENLLPEGLQPQVVESDIRAAWDELESKFLPTEKKYQ